MNVFYKIIIKSFQKISYFWNMIISRENGYINVLENNDGRVPKKLELSSAIANNNRFLAGDTVTIETSSKSLIVKAIYKNRVCFNHMSEIATSGIDVYDTNQKEYKWLGTIYPCNSFSMIAEKKINIDGNSRIVLYLPSFAEIKKLLIKCDNEIHIIGKKRDIIIYGSSISQGCASSRAALSYVNILSRLLNCDVQNFGFSEGCHGEQKMVEYISNLHAKTYIIEYDHNSNIKELNINHLNIYKIIRKKNPKSNIIFISRLSGGISISEEENYERIRIINSTYKYAINHNDKNVFFINGSELFNENKEMLLVDDRHPNDMGMNLIANKLYSIIVEKGDIKNEKNIKKNNPQ